MWDKYDYAALAANVALFACVCFLSYLLIRQRRWYQALIEEYRGMLAKERTVRFDMVTARSWARRYRELFIRGGDTLPMYEPDWITDKKEDAADARDN